MSFSVLPALNLADFDAGISMASPVLGLRPVRALRSETWKVPKPESVTLSPFRSAATMSSNTAFTTRSACPLGRSAVLASDSMRSALVMGQPISNRGRWLSMRKDIRTGSFGRHQAGNGRWRVFRRRAEILLGVVQHQRLAEHLIHVIDGADFDRLAHVRRDLVDVLLVLRGDDHVGDAAPMRGQHLLLEPA